MMAAREITSGWTVRELLSGMVQDARLNDRAVVGLCIDSRRVEAGDLFVSCAGDPVAARAHQREAVKRGAVSLVVAPTDVASVALVDVPVIEAADPVTLAGRVAARFHEHPSSRMTLVGITGTNGKTSVSHYIAHALHRPDANCGLLGTLGYGLYGDLRPGLLTTPDALSIQAELARLVQSSVSSAVMEVSSHALDQARVAGVDFDVAVFTNLSRDHLDYHSDMTAYGAAKQKLFVRSELHSVVINTDDTFGRSLLERIPKSLSVYAYGLDDSPPRTSERSITPVCGRILAAHRYSLTLGVQTPSAEAEFSTPVLGRFNAANLLAALGALLACGLSLELAVERLSDLPAVPGRMQRIPGGAGQPLVVVDYSHTPESLRTALSALSEHLDGRLWCVFGCGGDRDRGKRSTMGAIAARLAHHLVITDDNPRSEDGDAIVADIEVGIPEQVDALVIRSRAQAIRHAISNAGPGDIVLVAGKGHEPYQEIEGVRRPFSDAAEVKTALEESAR